MLYIDFSVVPPCNPLVRVDCKSGDLGADSGAEADHTIIMLITGKKLPGKADFLLTKEFHHQKDQPHSEAEPVSLPYAAE